jgi:hypothetical protein
MIEQNRNIRYIEKRVNAKGEKPDALPRSLLDIVDQSKKSLFRRRLIGRAPQRNA